MQLVSLSEINQVSRNANLDFLIVDEAHHVAAMANSGDRGQKQCFEICQTLAHKSKNLLLLSGMSRIGHEAGFSDNAALARPHNLSS